MSKMSKLSITPIDPKQETGPMGYCPYMNITAQTGSYKTLTEGLIAPEKRKENRIRKSNRSFIKNVYWNLV